jgi:ferredoxin
MGYFTYFVEGPFLWIVSLIFIIGVLSRFGFFLFKSVNNIKKKEFSLRIIFFNLGRFFLPLHSALMKKPFYTILLYLFHACMIVVPIWFSGHIALWVDSRFGWEWAALPDAWIDWMTIILLCLAALFLLRRILLREMRLNSSASDYMLLAFAALPFITGYFLTHGTLDSIQFLSNNMQLLHVLSAEAMILMVVILFCKTRFNILKCTGCAACELSCPTETIESNDLGKFRFFSYSHYQCIACGNCVKICPMNAAELKHNISIKDFFQIISKQELLSVELKECDRCGTFFAPEPVLAVVHQTVNDSYAHFCPNCRKDNLTDEVYHVTWLSDPENSQIDGKN